MPLPQPNEHEKQWHLAEGTEPSAQPIDAQDESASVSTEDDIAAAIVPDYAQHIDSQLEKRVLRKIDCYLIPFMWVGYGFVYYDKVRHYLATFSLYNDSRFVGNPRQCRTVRHDQGSIP